MLYRILSSLSEEQVEDILKQFEKEVAKQAKGIARAEYQYKLNNFN